MRAGAVPGANGSPYGGGNSLDVGANVRKPDDTPGKRVAVMAVAERVFRIRDEGGASAR
jgi:hypothetical protein